MNLIELLHDFICGVNHSFESSIILSVIQVEPDSFNPEELKELIKSGYLTRQDVSILQNNNVEIARGLTEIFAKAEKENGTSHKVKEQVILCLHKYKLSNRCIAMFTVSTVAEYEKYLRSQSTFV